VDDGRLLKAMQEASLAKKKVFTDPSTILPAVSREFFPGLPPSVQEKPIGSEALIMCENSMLKPPFLSAILSSKAQGLNFLQ
jgi:hypothetical protein